MLKFFIIFILVFSYQGVFSQFSIEGKIISDDTKEELLYATVFLQANSTGSSTDENGKFIIKINDLRFMDDTLVVRISGYIEKRIPVHIITNSSFMEISITPKIQEIDQVFVQEYLKSTEEALKILKKALKKKKKNFNRKAIVYDGFYRETLFENSIALKLNECKFQLNYSKYKNAGLSKRVFHNYWDDYWESSKFKPNYTLSYFAQNWPVFIDKSNSYNIEESRSSLGGKSKITGKLLGDPIGGPIDLVSMDNFKFELHFFDKKLKSQYIYYLISDQIINDTIECFVIKYRPNPEEECYFHTWSKKVNTAVYTGLIYIRKDDYSVVKYTAESKNWRTIIDNCDDKSSAWKRGYHPDVIHYEVDYILNNDFWTLSKVNYSSMHYFDRLTYQWDRTLVLNNPKEGSIKSTETIKKETIRYVTNAYNSVFWKEFEASDLYFPLDIKTKRQLEKDLPLFDQYEILNQSVEEIPKPIIGLDSNIIFDTNGNVVDKASFNLFLDEQNNYSTSVLHKFVDLEREFVSKTRRVIEFDYPDDSKKTITYPKYKIETDSAFQSIYFERNLDSTYRPIFNLSLAQRSSPNYRVDAIGFTKNHINYLEKSMNSPNGILRIFLKGNQQVYDSISYVSDYQIVNDTTILYIKMSSSYRGYQCYLHRIEDHPSKDELILHEPNNIFEIEANISTSKEFIFVYSASKDQNKVYSLGKSDLSFKIVEDLASKTIYNVDHFLEFNGFIINRKALSSSIYSMPFESKGFMLYSTDKSIEDFFYSDKTLLVTEYDLFDMTIKTIDDKQNEIEYDLGTNYKSIFLDKSNKDTLFFTVEGITRPMELYFFDFHEGKIKELDRNNFSYDLLKKTFVSKILYCKGFDGVEIPILITYDKNAVKDSIVGLFIETYGAYGAKDYAQFGAEYITYLTEGFILARPAIRGTSTLGNNWYYDGRQLNKKNTFDDFISSVLFLKKLFNLESKKVFAKGVSAGGLVMGVMANNYSDEFGGIILDRPFLNVTESMRDSTMFLTTLEYPEWGNPENIEVDNYILSYSPFQNIPKKISTNLFFRASYLDYIIPIQRMSKFVLESSKQKGDYLRLFKVDFNIGHMIPANYRRIAEEFSFMMYIIQQ